MAGAARHRAPSTATLNRRRELVGNELLKLLDGKVSLSVRGRQLRMRGVRGTRFVEPYEPGVEIAKEAHRGRRR
jgi:hypothetical protein